MIEEKPKFYKASCDAMFKAIFCKHKDLLESLLEEALKRKVKVEKILSPEIIKPNIHVKNKTLDILAVSENEVFNIELNINHKEWVNRRNAAYIFSKYSEDVKINKKYTQMHHYIQINLTSGLSKSKQSVNHYQVCDMDTREIFIDNLEIYEFNLDKLKDMWYNDINNTEYKLLVSLVCDKEELHTISKKDKLLEKVEREVVNMNSDAEFVEFLSQEEDLEIIHNTELDEAKQEGIEQNKLEIAKNLLDLNMDIKDIAKATGLTEEQIENLK